MALHHPYRYFIAGGQTRETIERFLREQDHWHDRLHKLEQAGRAPIEDFQERHNLPGFQIAAVFNGLAAFIFESEPEKGWKPCEDAMASPGMMVPDPAVPAGREMEEELTDIFSCGDAQEKFARWVGAFGIDTAPGMLRAFPNVMTGISSAFFEKIGDDYIVAMPVVIYADGDDWGVPPDSDPLPVSAYFARQEAAGNLSNDPRPGNRTPHDAPQVRPPVRRARPAPGRQP